MTDLGPRFRGDEREELREGPPLSRPVGDHDHRRQQRQRGKRHANEPGRTAANTEAHQRNDQPQSGENFGEQGSAFKVEHGLYMGIATGNREERFVAGSTYQNPPGLCRPLGSYSNTVVRPLPLTTALLILPFG